jgi:hypothetical protein
MVVASLAMFYELSNHIESAPRNETPVKVRDKETELIKSQVQSHFG